MSAVTKPYNRDSISTGVDLHRSAQDWLDAIAAGSCDADTFVVAITRDCRTAPDAAWEVLALLDQYHRRQKIPYDLFFSLKSRIEKSVIGNIAHGGTGAGAFAGTGTGTRTGTETVGRASSNEEQQSTTSPVGLPPRTRPVAGDPVAHAAPAQPPSPAERPAPAPRPATVPVVSTPPNASTAQGASNARGASTARGAPTPNRETAVIPGKVPAVGDVLRGRYRLLALLGRGGMGTVFEALDQYRVDMPTAGQRLAIKVLHGDVNNQPNTLAELRREFQHSQALSHPNIVRVHEFDRDKGTAFFTMELLHGALLSVVLRERRSRPLERAQALAIIRDVGAALVHAHSRDVVHGDLKPQNIFITDDGSVRVLDFGASHVLMREPWIADPETPQYFPVATPAYSSYEMLDGQRPDPRDDLYSLACMSYELLTGDHPFQRRTAVDARASRLRPRRPTGLTGRQWQALRAGLAWSRDRRPPAVQDWLRRLDLRAAVGHLPMLQSLMTPPPVRGSVTIRAALIFAAVLMAGGLWMILDRSTPDRLALARFVTTSGSDFADALGRAGAYVTTLLTDDHLNDAHRRTGVVDDAPVASPAIVAAPRAPSGRAATNRVAAIGATTQVASTPAPEYPLVPAPKSAVVAAPESVSIALTADTYDISPAETVARVTVRRKGNLQGALSFVWWTEDGSARAGEDFVSPGYRIEVIEDGQAGVNLLIPVVSDPERQHPRSFDVIIGEPGAGATLGAPMRATVIVPAAN